MAAPDWAQLEAADGVRFSWCEPARTSPGNLWRALLAAARAGVARRACTTCTGSARASPARDLAPPLRGLWPELRAAQIRHTRCRRPRRVGSVAARCAPCKRVCPSRSAADAAWRAGARNVWPNTRLEAAKCVLPLAALYTPLRALPELPVVPYDTVRCKGCAAVLNPYARVDFVGKARPGRRFWRALRCPRRLTR